MSYIYIVWIHRTNTSHKYIVWIHRINTSTYRSMTHPADGIDATHDDLIEMSVLEQLNVLDEDVLDAGPDLGAQQLVDAQPIAEVPQSDASQVVDLIGRTIFKGRKQEELLETTDCHY